ncbi:MAG: potassium channel family protein [Actinomycetes bacterium]
MSVLVVGLGRFGTAVARSLVRLNREVLVLDEDAELVEKFKAEFTHVVQADSTDEEALRQLGVGDFDRAVVAIGADIEASVLTVLALSEAGIQDIWAKAITRKHGQILERVGAHHVVYPESAMGERVAHMVTGSMLDYIEFDDGFAIARTSAPTMTWDKALAESSPRTHYGITVVGVKRPGEDFTYARPETRVERRDQLIVSGPTSKVEKFCSLSDLER